MRASRRCYAPALRTEARFPGLAAGAGHYESFFLRANRPSGGKSVWIRYTIDRPPGAPAVATAAAIPAGGDPAQYALAKLRIGEAHTLANGDKMVVAVIDSGIDLGHPELAGVAAGSFDALGKPEQPHQHGTAIAGAIAAHARLMGAAPAAKILAIRAFGAAGGSAEATTMAILKGVDYARCSGRASST